MRRRDGQATKERILRAAFQEFTKRGLAGARVDEIAERAKCNKALLYQYFGDKEHLFQHVLQAKMAELGKVEVSPGRFAECAGEFFDFYAANPWFARLVQWEALDFGCRAVPNEAERTRHFARHLASIEEAQQAGTVDPALDSRQTLFTLVGLIASWFAFPQTARMITGHNPYSPEALAARRAHVVDTARRMLEAR